MPHTAIETASILSLLYGKQFGGDFCEPFRVTWPQLRSLTGSLSLSEFYLKEIDETLLEEEYRLIPFNDFLVIMPDSQLETFRKIPDRLLESYIFEPEDIELGEYEDEDDEDEFDGLDENEEADNVEVEKQENVHDEAESKV